MICKTPHPPSLNNRYPYLHERLLPKKNHSFCNPLGPRKASRTLAPSRRVFLPRFPFPYAQFLTYMLLTHWLLTPLVASQLVLTLNCTGAIGLAHWCPSQMLFQFYYANSWWEIVKKKKVQTKEVPKKKIQDPPKKDCPNLSQEAVVGRTHCLCSHHCGALRESIVWRSSNNYMVILWCLHVKLVKLMLSS